MGRDLRAGLRLLGLLLLGLAWLPAAHAQIVSGSYVGNGTAGRTITGLGFRPDIVIVKVDFDGQADPNPPCSSLDDCSSAVIRTSTMAGANSKPVKGNQAFAGNMITAIGADGFTVGNHLKVNALNSCPASTTTPCTYYWTAIKADTSIKVGFYVGNGGTQPIAGLGFSPEWAATIPTDTASPMMRFSVDANTYHWWSGAPLAPTINSLDATGFTVQNGCGASCNQNAAGVTYHYIVMDDTPGHVKVGSYLGDATSPRTITSVGFQPAYLITRGMSPATFEQVTRSAAMPTLESVTFRSALTKVADGNSGRHIRGLLATGFVLGGGGGAGDLVNAAGANYSYLAIGDSVGCCNLDVAETASTITVTGPNRYELRFNQATGAGIDQLYDLVEDPSRVNDLAGGTTTGKTLYGDGLKVGGPVYNVTQDDLQAKLDLLEATDVRVRARQEAFYKQEGGALVLAGVKGTGDYSIYGGGRIAYRWNQRATSAVTYTLHDIDMNVHLLAAGPLSNWVPYSQTDGNFVPPNPGTDAFFVVQNGGAGARTDFLHIISKDWSGAGYLGAADSTDWFVDPSTERGNPYWEENTGATINAGVGPYSQQPGETWNFLTYFKPTNFTDNTDTNVTYRSADYRIPDSLSVTVGQPWIDASQNTGGGDDFNESEGAYVLTLDPTLGLTFQIDGAPTGPRYIPFFKIRQWRSLTEAPLVSLNGSPLVKGSDYKAAVKPLSRAHFAQNLRWHSTLQDSGSVTATPDVGTAGSVVGLAAGDFVAARYGKGVRISANTQYVAFSTSDFDRAKGAVEFWYQPTYNSADGVHHDICGFSDGVSNVFVLEKTVGNTLDFVILESGLLSRVRVAATDYSWRANDWVHIRLEWDDTLPLATQQRLFLNGVEPVHTDPVNDYNSGTLTVQPAFRFGNIDGDATFAPGVFDEIHLYNGSSTTPTSLARGGLTSNASEYLADPAKNYALAFAGVDASLRGVYMYLGTDSPFRGLNVSLATPGVWSTVGDVVWEYWNGTQWATLESGFGFTDDTNNFTKTSPIYWTGDPAGWAPYSVNGGPDLYYVRIHLAAGGAYSTLPVENVIKTDILLFQYCGDITAPAQQFQFGAPFPTAVKLASFGAQPGDGSVTLAWQTASELDNLGFHLYRALAESGPWTRLDASLIPGLGSSATGQDYSYRDAGLLNGTRYFYRLEDVDATSHATSHGPVSAVPAAGAAGAATGSDPGANRSSTTKPGAKAPSCPDWVRSAYGAMAGSPGPGHSSARASATRRPGRSPSSRATRDRRRSSSGRAASTR